MMEEQEIIDQPSDNERRKRRPTAITISCVMGFICIAITIPIIFSQTKNSFLSYLSVSLMINLISIIGLWYMKKWALYIYTLFLALNQLILITLNLWKIVVLLIPAIIIGIAWAYVKEMD